MPALPEMPQAWGNRRVSIIDVVGPTSYTQVTPGTPPAGPTGGQAVDATAFGLKFIEKIIGGLDAAGKYVVLPVGSGGSIGSSTSSVLQWITSATGAEVSGAVNLSTFTVRLMAIGR